jgi:hypothetical protein
LCFLRLVLIRLRIVLILSTSSKASRSHHHCRRGEKCIIVKFRGFSENKPSKTERVKSHCGRVYFRGAKRRNSSLSVRLSNGICLPIGTWLLTVCPSAERNLSVTSVRLSYGIYLPIQTCLPLVCPSVLQNLSEKKGESVHLSFGI